MNKKDIAWKAIFEKFDISKKLKIDGRASISAEQIKEVTKDLGIGKQEPRLLTKYDARDERAKILKLHNCTILAEKNGHYLILEGDGYHDVEEVNDVQFFKSKNIGHLQSLPSICTSESQVIDTAKASGLLRQFFGEDELVLTIRGRLRSGAFSYNFDKHSVSVKGVQVEVDSGYEGENVYLLEAKMGTRDNFITRQLYYPYRMWSDRIPTKEIIPVFISYSDKTFYIHQYKFLDKNQYNSIELIRSGAFVIEEHDTICMPVELINYKSTSFLNDVAPKSNEINIPFPQADDVRKVIDFIYAVAGGVTSKKEIAEYYGFDERQSDYYGNAARYLGFVDLEDGMFILTDTGRNYVDSSKDERALMMIKAMMESPTINSLYKSAIHIGGVPDVPFIAKIIHKNRKEINITTSKRRAQTMIKWLDWMWKKTHNI